MTKKILFVINTLGYGGAERAMLDLFDVLDPKFRFTFSDNFKSELG